MTPRNPPIATLMWNLSLAAACAILADPTSSFALRFQAAATRFFAASVLGLDYCGNPRADF